MRALSIALLAVLLVQLVLGAAMRHTASGLAIPDFPASYGGVAPPLTQPGIDNAIASRPYDEVTGDYTVAQVAVHFAHRLWAVIVVAMVAWFLAALMRYNAASSALRIPAIMLVVMLIAQVALGAAVIWTGRHHNVATTHQALGALILACATLLAVRVRLVGAMPEPHRRAAEPASAGGRFLSAPARLQGARA